MVNKIEFYYSLPATPETICISLSFTVASGFAKDNKAINKATDTAMVITSPYGSTGRMVRKCILILEHITKYSTIETVREF